MKNEHLKKTVLIDDRSSGTLMAGNGAKWRLVSDQVMGGRSTGELNTGQYLGKNCLHLQGTVTTANNGGFLQMVLDLGGGECFDASSFSGLALRVAGNDEQYNLHLRTSDLWMPWQSYRAGFVAGPDWREIQIPFGVLRPYRTRSPFNPSRLVRIGIVAIGRQFEADLRVGSVAFLANDEDA